MTSLSFIRVVLYSPQRCTSGVTITAVIVVVLQAGPSGLLQSRLSSTAARGGGAGPPSPHFHLRLDSTPGDTFLSHTRELKRAPVGVCPVDPTACVPCTTRASQMENRRLARPRLPHNLSPRYTSSRPDTEAPGPRQVCVHSPDNQRRR